MKYVIFSNTYMQTKNDFLGDEGDIFASITIDGYPEDENEEGAVIAEVFITLHRDIVVAWRHNGYRSNPDVLMLIEVSKTTLYNQYDAENTVDSKQGCANVYVKLHFDNEDYTIVQANCYFTPKIDNQFFIDMFNQIIATYTLDMGKTVSGLSFATKEEFDAFARMEDAMVMDVNLKEKENDR